MIKVKLSLEALKKMFTPTTEKGKKAKKLDNKNVDKEEAMAELNRLTTLFQNIELMQSETVTLQENLIKDTDKLNQEIEAEFQKFRENPVKIKKFKQADKELVTKHLMQYEMSEDEEQVDLEDIQVGDGKYLQFAQFSQNIRKFKKMIKAKQIIGTLKNKGKIQ